MLQQFNPKNKDIQVFVNDGLCHRKDAKVSVFDSSVQGGDAVWEGLRVYKGGIFCLDKHLERLLDSAKALAFSDIPDISFIKNAVFETLKANSMKDDVHIRLTLTRGEKITSGMDPRLNQNGSCLIVLAEWKPLVYDNDNGIKVITAHIQRNSPRHLDSKIHHANLLNNILAKIQANVAGKDAALMLDAYGFVAELNGTNLFMVKNNTLFTPHADACLHGITRGLIIEIAKDNNIPVVERNLSLTEFYAADEVFCTGTMGELTPVIEIDGRMIENQGNSNLLSSLQELFTARIPEFSEPLSF
jgi:branched-chain amino acid aminotransferase